MAGRTKIGDAVAGKIRHKFDWTKASNDDSLRSILGLSRLRDEIAKKFGLDVPAPVEGARGTRKPGSQVQQLLGLSTEADIRDDESLIAVNERLDEMFAKAEFEVPDFEKENQMKTLEPRDTKENRGENERSQSSPIGLVDHLDRRFTDFRTVMSERLTDFRTAMSERFMAFRAELGDRFTDFKAEVNERFNQVDKQFDKVDKQFVDMKADTSKQFADMKADTSKQFADMKADTDAKFDKVDKQFADMKADTDAKFDKVDKQFADMKADTSKQFADMRSEMNARFDKIDADAKWRFRVMLAILGLVLAILKLWQ